MISKEALHNVNNIINFDMNLGWLNALRSEESIMLLGYIYNDFILNLFLKHSSCTSQEKLPLCGRANCGETASLKNFYKFIHTVHMLFFTLSVSPKKFSSSGSYCNVSR